MKENNASLLHSGTLLVAARRSYERSLHSREEAMPSIVLSAMTLECFLNELEERLQDGLLVQPSDALALLKGVMSLLEDERASILLKIDAIHLILSGVRIDRGRLPFQDVRFLSELRNSLIHRRPENFKLGRQDQEYEPHKFVKYLSQRGVISRPPTTNPPSWSQYVLVPQTARWAHNTVVDMVQTIVGWLPPGNLRTTTEFIISDWQAIAT